MKIHLAGAEMFNAHKHDKAESRFSQFCKSAINTSGGLHFHIVKWRIFRKRIS